jgi:hypothetical protein
MCASPWREDVDDAVERLNVAKSVIDNAAKKGVLHKKPLPAKCPALPNRLTPGGHNPSRHPQSGRSGNGGRLVVIFDCGIVVLNH